MKPEKSESAGPSEDERGLLMEEQTTTVAIDFSQRDGIPLLKKFALFNSGMVALEQYKRDAYLLDELRTDSLRIDILWEMKASHWHM